MSFICLPSGHLWWLLGLCRGSSCQHRAAGMQQPGTQSSTQRHLQCLQLSHLTLITSPRLSRTLSGKPAFLPVGRQGGFCGLGCGHLPQEEQRGLRSPVLGPTAQLLTVLNLPESRMWEGCAGSAVSLMLTQKSSLESESLELEKTYKIIKSSHGHHWNMSLNAASTCF